MISCSGRVLASEAQNSELEFLKAWSYLEIIELQTPLIPHWRVTKVRRFQLAPWYIKYRVGGRGRRGCICMEAFCMWKMMKIAETKRREKQEFLHVTDWYPTLINLVGED